MDDSLLVCFLFLLATTKILPGSADTPPDPVRDSDGKAVHTGSHYYILPVIRGMGGGLTLRPARNKTCPPDVVQEWSEVSRGIPVTFSPVNSKRGVVRTSTDLNIKFSASTTCGMSTVWKLDQYDELRRQWFVTTGGVEGNPGRETTGNWFKINKFGNDYKLVFCPTVCNSCKVLCRDVGVYYEKDGKRVLSLRNEPLGVTFMKQ